MGKLSQKDKIARYDDLDRELGVYQSIAQYVFNATPPTAVEMVYEKDRACYYEFRLYGAERADGGTIVSLFRCKDQATHVDGARFDDWLRRIDAMPFGVGINTDVKIAADRLRLVRQSIYDRPQEG